MVAIVSGNSLGLSLTSLVTLGSQAAMGAAGQGRNGEQVYVNVATGNLVVQDQDERLMGLGLGVTALRTYNSQGRLDDDNADNWAQGIYRQQLALVGTLGAAGSQIVRVDQDGAQAIYSFDAAQAAYVNVDAAGAHDKITWSATAFTWTDGDTGLKQTYDATGSARLLSTTDTSGNSLSYNYDASGQIASIADASGETVFFDYTGTNLTQVRTAYGTGTAATTLTRVRYSYDDQNRLSGVTVDLTPTDNDVADGRAYHTGYTYEGTSRRISTITQDDGAVLHVEYVLVGGDYRVASVADAQGHTTTYTYDTAAHRTTVVDPAGQVTVFVHDDAGQLTRIENAVGATQFAYGQAGHLTRVDHADGSFVTMGYDAQGNQVSQQDSAGNALVRTYDARNQLLTETVFATAASGAAAAQDPLTTRHVYDAAGKNQLRFSISAEGRVTEYRYNARGSRTASIAYAAQAYAVNNLAAQAVPSEAAMSTWAALQDGTAAVRTDFAYDYRGQLARSTTYSSTDATGAGVLDGSQSVTQYVYDQSGALLKTVSATGAITRFTYDGMGRVLTARDALGNVTTTQYDDAGNKTSVTLANGLVTVSSFDNAGRLSSVVQSNKGVALGTTRYFYDADNRLLMTQDPTGVRSWTLYDSVGRKAADIDACGHLTEYRYNASNLLTLSIGYANPVDLSMLVDGTGAPANPSLAAIRPSASALDNKTWRAYDAADRLVKVVDARGGVTETQYDGASRVIAVIDHENLVDVSSFGDSVSSDDVQPMHGKYNRVTRNFYDRDGLLRTSIDGENYLTEFRYDAAGRLVDQVRYASRDANVSLMLDADAFTSLASGDQRTHTLYNARGQVAGVVDAEGYLTENVYDLAGNLKQVIRYATAVNADLDTARTVQALRPASSAADQSTTYAYDLDNRVIQQTDTSGTVTQFVYDEVGKLTTTTVAANTADVRLLNVRYDVQGRVTARLSAEGGALLTGSLTATQLDAIWSQYGTSYTYDAASRLTSETDPNGLKTRYVYDTAGRLTHSINAAGEMTVRHYNPLGQLTSQVMAGQRLTAVQLAAVKGGIADAAFHALVDPVVAAGPNSVTSYEYNALGQVSRKADALGADWSYAYNAFGEVEVERRDLTSVETPLAATEVIQRAYDRRGMATSVDHRAGPASTSSRVSYDAFGRAIETHDGNGNRSTATYDRLGRVIATTDALNATRVTTYDAFSRVHTQTDATGNTTTYAYDDAARSTTLTTAEGVSITTVRNPEGQVHTVTDGRGNTTTTTYDKNGALTGTTTPLTTTGSTYDRAGRLLQTTDANGNKVDYTYDAANRVLTRTVDAAGLKLKTTYEYDAKGEQTAVIDPNQVRTEFTYSDGGLVLSKTQDAGGLKLKTSYEYDPQGNVLKVTSPGGTVTRYVYDGLGRRTEEHVDPNDVDPNGLNLTRRYSYDANGNVLAATDENGHVTRYAYDADDRLVATIDPTGRVSGTLYDAEGRVRITGSLANTVDVSALPAGRFTPEQLAALLQFDPAHDQVELRSYDRDGRLRFTVNGGGDVTELRYDASGNVSERIAYATRLASVNLADPAWEPAPASDPAHDLATRRVYDALGRAIYSVDGNGGLVQQKFDGNGNVIERKAYAKTIAPDIGLTQSLLDAAAMGLADDPDNIVQRYQYDKAGRLSYSVDGMNAVTHFEYDDDGNLVRRTDHAATLAAGADPASVAADATRDRVTQMAYDKAGRCVYTVAADGALVKRTYDGNGNVVLQSSYANKVPAGTPITIAALDGILHSNADRTTRAVFDAANRQVFSVGADGAVRAMRYDAHGNLIHTVAYASRLTLDDDTLLTEDDSRLRDLVNAPEIGLNRHTRMAYDAANRLVFTVDATGGVKGTEYDGVGRVLASTVYGNLGVDPVLDTSGESIAAAVAVEDSRYPNRVDRFEYDACGYLRRHTDALGHAEEFAYDGLGNKIRFTNKNQAVWTYEYDANGKLVREISPQVDLFTLVNVLDESGRPVLVSGSALMDEMHTHDSIVTAYTYDAFGNLKTRTEAQGRPEERTTTYSYDKLGHQVRVDYPKVGVYNAAADSLSTTGLAERIEFAEVSLYTQTLYDVFGQAVANRDVSGHWSYKAYDKAGQVRYDVDAAGYVTGYTRDTFGDVTQLQRYAAPTSMGARGEAAPDIAAVESVLGGVDHTEDRIVTSHYDRLGRTVRVEEPTTWVHEGVAGREGVSRLSSKATRMKYNAFGELQKQESLRSGTVESGEWVGTTHYYDALGQETATVDALGYLTTKAYDHFGNLTAVTEFADAITSWTEDGFAPGGTSMNDRTLKYDYDRLNRKVREYREHVNIASSYGDIAVEWDDVTLETTYGYDAVGNLTRTSDARWNTTTYSYYDALGRVTAVAAPLSGNVSYWSSVIPLTEFHRDAYGNVLVKIDHKQGAQWADESGYLALDTSAQPEGRRTFTAYDKHGHAIQTTDAAHHTQYASYDAAGHLAKQWTGVTSNGVLQTSFTATRYDALGQAIDTVQPGTVGQPVVHHQQAYNAFGEVTSRGVNGVEQEYFRYDAAGNLWQTNEGDGVDRVMLYDQQGHLTAEIRSSTPGLIGSLSVTAADALGGTRRVESRYDALGRAVERVTAERATDGVSGFSEAAVGVRIVGSTINSVAVGRPIYLGNPNNGLSPRMSWSGQNSVTLSWYSLAGLGQGMVKVEFDYLTSTKTTVSTDPEGGGESSETVGGLPRTRSVIVGGADLGTTVTWEDTDQSAPTEADGGISAVTRVRLYKQDAAGNWHLMADNGSGAPLSHHVLVAKPGALPIGYSPSSAADPIVQVRYRKVGDTTFTTAIPNNDHLHAQVIDFGDALYVDTTALSGGMYEYEVWYRNVSDGVMQRQSSGQWLISAPPLAVIGDTPTFATNTSSMLRWPAPTEGIEQRLHVRQVGSSTWSTLSIQSLGSGLSGADFAWLGEGDFEYELLYEVSGQNLPYAHATGRVHVTPGQPPVLVPPVGEAPPIPATLSVGSALIGGNVVGHDSAGQPIYQLDAAGNIVGANYVPVLRWAKPVPGANATFTARRVDTGQTVTLAVVNDLVDGVVRGLRVDLSTLAAGEYDTRLTYSGSAWPLGGLSAGRLVVLGAASNNTLGHYENRTITTTVPVTVTPPDPANYAVLDEDGRITGYTAPVVLGTEENGLWIFGEGYTGDYAGGGTYENVRAVPVTHYETSSHVEQVWVPDTSTVGHYEDRTLTTTEQVTVTPADPINYAIRDEFGSITGYLMPVVVGLEENGQWIFGEGYTGDYVGRWTYENVRAVPVTHTETHTQVQHVWIPGLAKATAYTDQTPPYTPAHTLPAVPKTYSATSTTVAGTTGVSEGASNDAVLFIATLRDTSEQPTVFQTYDRWGNVLSVTDPRSRYWVTEYSYDWGNRVTAQYGTTPEGWTDRSRPQAKMVYDGVGNLLISVDAQGNSTYRNIDGMGHLLAETHDWTTTAQYSYNAYGEKVQSIDGMGNITQYEYDDAGLLKTTRHLFNGGYGTEQAKRYTVDANSVLHEVQDWTPTETNEYDELGRKTRSTNANDEVTSYVYDLQGNVVSTTSLGRTTTASYDTQNRRISETDANGATQTWKYDYFGRYAPGVAHVDIGGAQYTYRYNGTGELVQQDNNRGQHIVNSYDNAGQLVRTAQTTRVTNFVGGQGYFDEGIEGYLRTSAAPGYKPVYQVFFGGDAGHFYTTDYAEYLRVRGTKIGIVGYVAESGDATHVALYRLRWGSGHVYLSSPSEVQAATNEGWVNEGVIGYIGTVDDDTSTAWYRVLFNGGADGHYYTTDRAERNRLVGLQETNLTSTTSYTYDLAGNRLSEHLEQGGVVYQDNRMAYDAQGRLRLVTGLSGLRLNHDYDRNGNRIHTRSEFQEVSADGRSMALRVKDSWSKFDNQNRQVIAEGVELRDPYAGYGGGYGGSDDSGAYGDWASAYNSTTVEDAYGRTHIVAINHDQGHVLEYDNAGNRVGDTRYGKVVRRQGGQSEFKGYTVWRGYDDYGNRQYILDDDNKRRVYSLNEVHYSWQQGRYYVGSVYEDDNTTYVDGIDSAYETVPVTYTTEQDYQTSRYTYDHLGRLVKTDRTDFGYWDRTTVETREYDGAGRALHEGPGVNTLDPNYVAAIGDQVNLRNRVNHYDVHGQMTSQHVQDSNGYVPYDVIYDRYDQAGNALRYHVDSYHDDKTSTTRYSYVVGKMDGYKEGGTYVGGEDLDPGRESYAYDQNGRLVAVKDHTQPLNDRSFVNDANGVVVQTVQAGRVLRNLVVNGEVIGQYGVGPDANHPSNDNGSPNLQTVNTTSSTFRAISSNFPSAGVGSYQVQPGDTLKTIATGAYGDASLWWKIAQNNGLTGDADLRVGQMITIPATVDSGRNNASTFRPFDASAMVGDTTPNLPTPEGADDCGGFGQVLVVVVAIAVTFWTAGALSTASSGIIQTMIAGANALATSVGTLGGALLAAESAAVGSIVSQAFAVATNIQTKFDWKGVAMSALGAAVASGIGAQVGNVTGNVYANAAVRAAIGNAITQKIAVATHLQKQFQWKMVTASAVGGAVGELMNSLLLGDMAPDAVRGAARTPNASSTSFAGMFQSKLAADITAATLSGFASGVTVASMRGGHIDAARIAADSFGNALASSYVYDALATQQAEANSAAQKQAFRRYEIRQQNAQANEEAYGPSILAMFQTKDVSTPADATDFIRPSTGLYGYPRYNQMMVMYGDQPLAPVRGASNNPSALFDVRPPSAAAGSPEGAESLGVVDERKPRWSQNMLSGRMGWDWGNGTWAYPLTPDASEGGLPDDMRTDLLFGGREKGAPGVPDAPFNWGILGQQLIATAGTPFKIAADTYHFAEDQVLGLMNGLTGGWWASKDAYVAAADQRNQQRASALFSGAKDFSIFTLRAMTGNMGWDEASGKVSSTFSRAMRSEEIDALEARGDYVQAQMLRTENVLNVATVGLGGVSMGRSLLASTSRELGVGLALTRDDVLSLPWGGEPFGFSGVGNVESATAEALASGKYARRTDVSYRAASDVNATYPEGWSPPYKPGTQVTEFTTTIDDVYVRVHGEDNKARSWMMKREAIQGLSPEQIQSKYALPEVPTYMSDVYVPSGTRVRTGIVNPVFDGVGNAIQYELLQRLPATAFRNTVRLGQ